MSDSTPSSDNKQVSRCYSSAACLWDVNKEIFALDSVPKLLHCLEKLGKENEKCFCSIMTELLTFVTNEMISDRCLQRDQEFFEKLAGNPDFSPESELWTFLRNDEQMDILGRAVMESLGPKKAKNLVMKWAKNIQQMVPYFEAGKAEKELIRSVSQWICSPDITKSEYDIWEKLASSSSRSILLKDLRSILKQDFKNRMFDEFKQAVEDLSANELSTEASAMLYKYLNDVLRITVEVREEKNGKRRLIIAQKVMFLSSVKMEEWIEVHPEVYEVNIYAKKMLFIDCDLESEYMHGKNLAVVAGMIVVRKEDTVFDVSGLNHSVTLRSSSDRAPDSGDDGKPGTDGNAGESSGNVSIVTSEIVNSEWLTVKLCGGDAEGGQNGGRGGDGKIGTGVTRSDLNSLCVSYGSIYWTSMAHFINYQPREGFKCTFSRSQADGNQYLYDEYEHSDGRTIQYSLAGEKVSFFSSTRYDLYFLVKGAPGGPPGIGGRNGVGGEGGRRGEFVALSLKTGKAFNGITVESHQGRDGENGSCGRGGNPGMNGNDMAMIDMSVGKDSSKFYIGGSGKDKIKTSWYCNASSDGRSRFNGYYKYNKGDSECFVKFDEVVADPISSARTTEKRTASDRSSEAKSVSHQAILLESVVSDFNSFFADDEELLVEEIVLDQVWAEEEEETEEQIQEEITVVRTQMEDVGAHQNNARSRAPKEDEIVQRIKTMELTLVNIVDVLKDVFSACVDVTKVEMEIYAMMKKLEDETVWDEESKNGYLKNGMSKKEFTEFLRRTRSSWPEKLDLSTMTFTIDTATEPDMALSMEDDELADVISVPLDNFWSELDSKEFRTEFVSSLMKDVTKYWMDHEVLLQINVIHKELKKVKCFDKFEKKDLDWSNQLDVQAYFKSFMSKDELKVLEEEAKVAEDVRKGEEEAKGASMDVMSGADGGDDRAGQVLGGDNPPEEAGEHNGDGEGAEKVLEGAEAATGAVEANVADKGAKTKKGFFQPGEYLKKKYAQAKETAEKAKNVFISKKSQFSDVEKFLNKNSELKELFKKFEEVVSRRTGLIERFTLELNCMGQMKPVGSHATSLIFMRYFTEQILEFNSKMFRYHLKYRNEASTPTDWLQKKEDLQFKNYGMFMIELRKHEYPQIGRTFKEHLETMGLRSASYRLMLAEKKNIHIQLFCESGYAKMRLVESVNSDSEEIYRLFLNRKGEVTSVAPNDGVRRLRAVLNSSEISRPLPLSEESDLTPFVIPSVRQQISHWSEALSVAMDSPKILQFLRRLFDLRGFDMPLVELQFLMNTLIDCVCNQDVFIEKICYRLLSKHGSLHDVALTLRIMKHAHGQCPRLFELVAKLHSIKDKRLQALFGTKLLELDWNIYRDKLDLLVYMLSHAENCFAQLVGRPLEEWIDIAECQKWDNFEPLMAEYGTAGYFFILLDSAGRKEVLHLRLMVDELKKEHFIIYEKLISRLTFLIYFDEITFDEEYQKALRILFKKGSDLVCHDGSGKETVTLVTDEGNQQQWISQLKSEPQWETVFPKKNRTLEELLKLTMNPNDSPEEKAAREKSMTGIGRMIESNEGKSMEVLRKIDDVLFKLRGLRLRDTQKIAVLSGYHHPRNILCQVNTGEGKSYIITALAILRISLDGGTVDIITSSSVLAQRDAESMKDIYEEFDIDASHNCDEDSEKRKKAYQSSVVYGDIARFERDYLLHNFYKKNILGGRQRDCVIVDEVDSMFLDNGSNMLYLSHNVPGLELLESLFVFLHKEVYTQRQEGNSVSMSARLRKAVLVDLFGMVSKEDINQLLLYEKQTAKISTIWRHLVKNNVIDAEGVVQQADEKNLLALGAELLESCGALLTKRVMGMLAIVSNRRREIQIPNYLFEFVLLHLDEFVDNALKGLFLQHNDEYVIDVDRSGRTGDRHPLVTIIDKGTGTDLSSSQWSEGLHQFLQLKHGCKLTSLSLKAVFVSNVSYLKGYGKINGFSGTLGSKVESDSLRELYDADVMRIPTWKPKEFNENAPVLAKSEATWITELHDELCDQFNANRSVLLICKSISDVRKIYRDLNQMEMEQEMNTVFENAVLYQREFDEFDFENTGGLRCRQLIISTNLAGRGTDIKLNEELVDAGGLHVIVSFLPENSRIEDQAYGRAARCGQPGSGQIIALIDENASGASNIFQLKQFRDNGELHRLRSLKQFYDFHIDVEEACLRLFQDHSSGSMAMISAASDDILPSNDQVIYFALLDEWAIWLDKQKDLISRCEKNANDSEKQAIITSAKKFMEEHPICEKWDGNLEKINWLRRPQPLLALALNMINGDQKEAAQKLLLTVSEQFPDFSAEAYYYMGVNMQQKIREWKKFKREETEKDADKHEGSIEKDGEGSEKTKKEDGKLEKFRKWCGNQMEDFKNWTLRGVQKIGPLEDSPDFFVHLNEAFHVEATTLFLKSRSQFIRRIRRKKQLKYVVMKLQQGGVEASSRGYIAQQEDAIAVWEAFVGNIDDMLGHTVQPRDLLVPFDEEHIGITRIQALRGAGILSPVVLTDDVDEDALIPVANSNCLPTKLLNDFVEHLRRHDGLPEFEGRKVVDVHLLEDLPLPSAIGFWGSLRRCGCFIQERFFVAIKKNKEFSPLKSFKLVELNLDPFDLRLTEYDVKDYDFYELADDARKIAHNSEDNATLRKLMDLGLAYMEIVGQLNPLVVGVKPNLDQFDFITIDTLVDELGILESEANWILNKLVDVNILKTAVVEVEEGRIWATKDTEGKATKSTCCTTVFVQENKLSFEGFPENIRDSLWIVFTRHFSYGYALKALQASCKEEVEDGNDVRHQILLPSKPYCDLFEDMLNGGILVHSRMTDTLKEIYKPENPLIGSREDYLNPVLYEKLSKLSPWMKVNTCKLRSTQEYMREKCVPASAETRSALANGLKLVAYVTEPNRWRFFAGIFAVFAVLLTAVLFFIGAASLLIPIIVLGAVGSILYFMSMMKENQKVLASSEIPVEEEFKVLRKSHQVAMEEMRVAKKNDTENKKLQGCMMKLCELLRDHILSQCYMTDDKTPVDDEMISVIRECIGSSPLTSMLKQTVETFLSTNIRQYLAASDTALADPDLEPETLEFSGDPVIMLAAFETALIVDVNREIRRRNKHREEKIEILKIDFIPPSSFSTPRKMFSQLKSLLEKNEKDLATVLAKEMHSVLNPLIDDVIIETVHPLINQMTQAWREKQVQEEGQLCLDEKTRKEKSTAYSAERLAKAHASDFLEKDLHGVFLRMCFREQKPAVICHMVKYNYPMSTHCARMVVEGVLTLLGDLNVGLNKFEMKLLRKNDVVYEIKAERESGEGKSCLIKLIMRNDCFYVTDPESDADSMQPCGLFEALCVELEEIATEFSLGADFFQTRLMQSILKKPDDSPWKLTESWTSNEKLKCSVPL